MQNVCNDNKTIGDKKIEMQTCLEKNGWKACKIIKDVSCVNQNTMKQTMETKITIYQRTQKEVETQKELAVVKGMCSMFYISILLH